MVRVSAQNAEDSVGSCAEMKHGDHEGIYKGHVRMLIHTLWYALSVNRQLDDMAGRGELREGHWKTMRMARKGRLAWARFYRIRRGLGSRCG